MGFLQSTHRPHESCNGRVMNIFLHAGTLAIAATLCVVNLAHPFIHSIEGGSIDAVITQANVWVGFMLHNNPQGD